MAYYRDFREYLARLEDAGKLRRISKTVDRDRELHPLVRWQYRGLDEEDRTGFLFEQLTDRHGKQYRAQVASSVLACNREVYAMAMGCPLEEVHERWAMGSSNLIAPECVATGPVKEEIHKGEGLLEHDGFNEFPVPVATNGWEAFPRITAAGVFSRDPDTGSTNVGMYNGLVLGPARGNLRTSRHMHRHWEKYRQRGEPLPVAIVIGAVPVLSLVASTDIPYGVSELDVAGGIIGEPIQLVRCETVDISVPATAEIVIEGEIPIDILDRDGPSGENRGHVMLGHLIKAFKVTCITHRRNPIWHDIIEGFPPTESSLMRSVNCEGRVFSLFAANGITNISDVAFHHAGSARHICVISFKDSGGVRTPNSEVWRALYTVMSVGAGWPKLVIAVDDDIDPHDLESVLFAMIDRHQPHRDVKIIQGRSAGLDESVGPHDSPGRDRMYPSSLTSHQGASIMLVDATRKWAYPPVSLPKRDYMDHARDLWEQLDLPPLKPRVPWHGVSLGRWPAEEAELVELAEQGREDEAAALLLSRGAKLADGDSVGGGMF